MRSVGQIYSKCCRFDQIWSECFKIWWEAGKIYVYSVSGEGKKLTNVRVRAAVFCSQASYLFLPFTVPGKNKPNSCICKLQRLKTSPSSLFQSFSSVAAMVFIIASAPGSPLSSCTEGLNSTCFSSSKCKPTIPTHTNSWVMIIGRQCLCTHLQRVFPVSGEWRGGVSSLYSLDSKASSSNNAVLSEGHQESALCSLLQCTDAVRLLLRSSNVPARHTWAVPWARQLSLASSQTSTCCLQLKAF